MAAQAVAVAPPVAVRAPAGTPAGAGVEVVSLNLAMREDAVEVAAALASIGAADADVLLFQEVVADPDGMGVATALASALGLSVRYRPSFALDDGRMVGLATLSRFPIVETRTIRLTRFDLRVRTRDRIALAVTLATPDGPVAAYNVHLDTRLNTGDRLKQLTPIIAELAGAAGPAIVAGDFNTNPHRWLLHLIPLPFLGRQGGGVERFMAAGGLTSVFGGGATHDLLGMRLDWVFVKALTPTTAAIVPTDLSDHHALVVSLSAAAGNRPR
jgi:endonuclease/exonuclease/phosphatase (EEP) superfamily protein YafD